MRNTEKKIRSLVITLILVGLCAVSFTTAWATISYIKPKDATHAKTEMKTANMDLEVAQESKARAPEPSTMALFGGGFLGMIAGFIRKTYAVVKRIFDIISSILGFIVLSPLFLLTAVLVKLTSKGPIIYTQTRVGKNGIPFKIYKFRTMKIDAEKETGPVWASQNDNRLTPVGGFLRKSHIDEIPQLYNVLKGEMSVIGPRPERPIFVDEFKKAFSDYEMRLLVRPGITGLAQVWHRYDETIADVKKKLKYDLLYIKKMCLWADLNIILRTFRVVVTGEGAR